MLLQGIHASFLCFQILTAWELVIKGIELRPEVIQKLRLTDINRQVYPYLTVWNLILHTSYLVACTAEDVLVALTNGNSLTQFKKKFSKNRAFFFETLVFPGSLTTVTVFWGFTLIDPLYLFPGQIEDLIPGWINFLIHSGVGIFAVAEVILRSEVWSPHHGIKRLQIGCTILASYAIVFCLHRYLSGAWIYPFVEFLSWPQIIAIFLLIAIFAVFFYHLGYFLSFLIHGNTIIRSKQI